MAANKDPTSKITPKQLPKQSFCSSFESFLQTKKQNAEAEAEKDTKFSSSRNSQTGNNKLPPEPLEPKKWGQHCENCSTIVQLIFYYLKDISEGKYLAIEQGTPETEIITGISHALGFNERQVVKMVQAEDNPHKCRFCMDKFASRQQLTDHVKKDHIDIATIPCPECDKWYKTEESLKYHLKSAHKPIIKHDYPCPVSNCNQGYMNFGILKRHIKKKHPEITLPNVNDTKIPKPKKAKAPNRGAKTKGARGTGRSRGRPPRKQKYVDDETEEDEASESDFFVNSEDESSISIDGFEDRF